MGTPEFSPSQSPSSEAIFRYQLVSQVLTCLLGGGGRGECVRMAAALEHRTLEGAVRQVSARTLRRWLCAYEAAGLAGLEPQRRASAEDAGVLPEKLMAFLEAQKQDDPEVSIPEILARARELMILKPGARICRTTVWRVAKRLGISVQRVRHPAAERDARRFAYAHRMQMVLCDGKHFRAGIDRAKRVALFFLDDASRYGLHVVVGTSESTLLFLRGLYEVVAKYGVMGACYLDHGPGFIADDTVAVFGALEVPFIHGRVKYPQGRGKLEVFNRGVKANVLRVLVGRPDVDPACAALELRLGHYLETRYNHTPHEELALATPSDRFFSDEAPLRSMPDDRLRSSFVVHFERTVSNDHIVPIDSTDYEVPRGLASRKATIYHRILEGDAYYVVHGGRMVRIHPVDLAQNARSRRGQEPPHEEEAARPLPRSAADIAFERDFPPLVGPDGGYSAPTEHP